MNKLVRLATLVVASGFTATTAIADEPKLYPYHGKNYCPAGLQPISMGGVICCGVPNQTQTYQQALAHPRQNRKKVTHTHVKTHTHHYTHTHRKTHSHGSYKHSH